MREFLGQWERYWIDPREFVDAGTQILVVGRQYGTGAASQQEALRSLWG